LDANWQQEIGVRLAKGSHYLDFTGSGLYTQSQLAAASHELATHVYGNPHCTSPSSLLVDEELKEARAMVLNHFSADPNEYAVVFTRWACGGGGGWGGGGCCCGTRDAACLVVDCGLLKPLPGDDK